MAKTSYDPGVNFCPKIMRKINLKPGRQNSLLWKRTVEQANSERHTSDDMSLTSTGDRYHMLVIWDWLSFYHQVV